MKRKPIDEITDALADYLVYGHLINGEEKDDYNGKVANVFEMVKLILAENE